MSAPESPAGGRGETAWAIGLPVAVGILALAVWQAAAKLNGIPQVLLPAPSDVLREMPLIFGDLAANARVTGFESLAAFVLATALGLLIAIALNASTLLREAVFPNLVLFQVIPKIALAPLFIFWLGIGAPSRLTYAVFISFFPVALGALTGFARADPGALKLCRALTASRWQSFFAVELPYALPYVFAGAKVAATMSIIGVVVGEFISASDGLGYYILAAQARGETAHIFGAIFVLCLIGLAIYAIAATAEYTLRRWWRG